MKYCFEKYEFGDRGRIFLGFEQVNAGSSEDARQIVQDKVGDNIHLAQIFVYQEQQ